MAALQRLVRFIPERVLAWLARLATVIGWRLDDRHREVALENLARAFPDLEAGAREEIARRSFANLARTLLDGLTLHRFDAGELAERFDVEGWENLDRAEAAGHGVVLMTAHLGNWEGAGQALAARGRPFTFVAREMSNPLIEQSVRRIRERFGNRMLPKRGGTRKMLRTLKGGGRIVLLIDQRVHPHEGKAYRFFDHPAYTSPLLAELSLRTGAPIVPFFGIPQGKRYRLVLHDPIFPGSEGAETVDEITLASLQVVEAEIRRDPGLWLWMHRRWRKNPASRRRRTPRRAAGPDSTEVIG